MWIFLVFLKLGAFYSAVSSSPATLSNVHFASVNLRNVLHWLPGNGTTEDAHFTVQYTIYGDSMESSRGPRVNWRQVRQCTEIMQNWCDLSNETRDLEHQYFARVRVMTRESSSKWIRTERRFDPKQDTIFGPPSITVELQSNSAIITLKGPMRYQPNNDTPLVSMASLYPRMTYNLSINNTHQNKTNVFLAVSSPHIYQRMEYNTQYCFTAKTSFPSLPVVCQQSPWHCIATPPDPMMELTKMVVAGLFAATLCICFLMLFGYFLIQYLMGKGQKSPSILERIVFHQPLFTFPPEKPNVILFAMIKDNFPSDITIPRAYQAQPNPVQAVADPAPSSNPSRAETPSEHDEHWDDLSVDYGTVVAVPKSPGIARECGENGQISLEGNGKKDCRLSNDHHAAIAASQMMSYFPQRSKQIHTPMYSQKETVTLLQARRFDPEVPNVTPALWPHPLSTGVEKEEPGSGSLGLLHITRQLEAFSDAGEIRGGNINVKKSEGEGEEREPFLSGYASQSFHDRPLFQTDQSDCTSDYGFLMTSSREAEDDEEGWIIDWDPETRRLTLPMLEKACNLDEGLEKAEMGSKYTMKEGKEVKEMSSPVNLDSVFVRQNSDERDTQGEWVEDILMTKWNVLLSMDG